MLPLFCYSFSDNNNIRSTEGKVFSFEFSTDTANVDLSSYMVIRDKYVINDTIDLQGKTLYFPSWVRVELYKGLIKNGNVVGNNTLLFYDGVIFDKVHVFGKWVVDSISTSMFADLSYDNSLKDVFSLADPRVENTIVIDTGTYYISALEPSDHCLVLGSNSDLTLDGNIILNPNFYPVYSILYLKGENIYVHGKGSISGDKDYHIGNEGEWGLGIDVAGGDNIRIEGMTVKDCWGDCIYIQKKTKSVSINNCVLYNGRRQGISVISAQEVKVNDCLIFNIGGTRPGYAIDIEPTKGEVVHSVVIDNVIVTNCRGGFATYGRAKDSRIDSVIIKNCSVGNSEYYPMSFIKSNYVMIEYSKINKYKEKMAIECIDIDSVCFNNVKVNAKRLKKRKNQRKYLVIDNVENIIYK